jgi:hypothetical protein
MISDTGRAVAKPFMTSLKSGILSPFWSELGTPKLIGSRDVPTIEDSLRIGARLVRYGL